MINFTDVLYLCICVYNYRLLINSYYFTFSAVIHNYTVIYFYVILLSLLLPEDDNIRNK